MAVYRCAACGAVHRISRRARAPVCRRCRRPLDTSGTPQAVDAAALASALLSSPAPVLVDFSPPGEACSCLDALACTCAGQVVCLKVDTGREPAAAAAWSVDAAPAVVLFRRGLEQKRRPPAPPADIERWLAEGPP